MLFKESGDYNVVMCGEYSKSLNRYKVYFNCRLQRQNSPYNLWNQITPSQAPTNAVTCGFYVGSITLWN